MEKGIKNGKWESLFHIIAKSIQEFEHRTNFLNPALVERGIKVRLKKY